jgi:hypothetical protein
MVELSENPLKVAFTKIPTKESEVGQARSVKNKHLPIVLRETIFG